ncbi:MAG: hypothetical protein ACTSPW_20820 [Promethearchaeota archaeon]
MRVPFIKNVVGTETRGVSQREGSVTATARYLIDSRIYSLDQGYEIEDLKIYGIFPSKRLLF